MMTFAAQIHAVSCAVARADAASQQLQDEKRKESERKRKYPQGAPPSANARKRESYQTAILAALKRDGTLSSSAIGYAMGAGRLTAYKRLLVLEKDGLVLRIGSGVKTKWKLACPVS